MPTPVVVQAQQSDAELLASLIYASAAENLNSVFSGHKDDLTTAQRTKISVAYLRQALQSADGQFGYQNQYVIRHGSDLSACVSFWVNPMPDSFKQATLTSLLNFFSGLDCALILRNSQHLAQLVQTPDDQSLSVGHLAVGAKYRRQGHSKALLDFCEQQARSLGKTRLILDLNATNDAALKSYQSFGFKPINTVSPTDEGIALGLSAHIHMCKSLR
ncbi:GNAT family N-acetyltransferase [Aliiglaciecola litoralis]|uniref:N-acetyltransferase domain-containing protein n=1 Tax=Aliiglaciecola litoralis TaxID=582857 RepID=A0ABP3WQA2_9ALTE